MLKNIKLLSKLAIISASLSLSSQSFACSRIVYQDPHGSVVTGRSMDWFEDVKSNLYVFPRGLKRDGSVEKNALTWTSKYGSVVTAGYDIATADGMNEKGLVANMLYLAEADFGTRDASRPGISFAAWVQYILDNFASVSESVDALKEDKIQIVPVSFGEQVKKPATLHVAISDPSGDSAILEYLDGKLVIHHGKEFQVMTNSPTFDQQLALNAYWETVDGDQMLPGTHRAADRFVRASYYVKNLPSPKDERQRIAGVFSVLRNVSVPFGTIDPEQPNIAPTIWRTMHDQSEKVMYFESALSPYAIWVPLNNLNFEQGAPSLKLQLVGKYDLAGDVSHKFEPTDPFKFLSN